MLCTFVTLQRHAFRVILSVAKPKIIRYDFWQVKPPKARSRQSRASAGDRRRLCDGGEREAESKFRGGKGNAPRRNRGATATKGSVMDFRRLVIRNVTFCIARLRLPLSDPASADGLAHLLARRMARLANVRLACGSLRMTRKKRGSYHPFCFWGMLPRGGYLPPPRRNRRPRRPAKRNAYPPPNGEGKTKRGGRRNVAPTGVNWRVATKRLHTTP